MVKVYDDKILEIPEAEVFKLFPLVVVDQGYKLTNAAVVNGMLMVAFRRLEGQVELSVHTVEPVQEQPVPPPVPTVSPTQGYL